MNFLRQDNNYRTLKAFKKAECIYDVTYYFANKFLKSNDRTIDQMIQAARSGKQNLAEGNIDGITSREMELKLTNVNRASLHELLLDYEDYLRVDMLLKGGDDLVTRTMDMTEGVIRAGGRSAFRLDCCLESLSVEMKVRSEDLLLLTTEKKGSYREYTGKQK